MKLRYVIDIDVDYDYEGFDELQFKLKDELEEYVKDSELGYYADKTSVKLQDDYCIKEEKKRLNKQLPKTVKEFLPLNRAKCPACNGIMGAHASRKYCYYCGQALEWHEEE